MFNLVSSYLCCIILALEYLKFFTINMYYKRTRNDLLVFMTEEKGLKIRCLRCMVPENKEPNIIETKTKHSFGELVLMSYPDIEVNPKNVAWTSGVDPARKNLRNLRNFSHCLLLKCEPFCGSYCLSWFLDRAVPSSFWLRAAWGYIHLTSRRVNDADMITVDFGNKIGFLSWVIQVMLLLKPLE